MKQIISALFLLYVALWRTGIVRRKTFSYIMISVRSLYDKDLKDRPVLTSTVESFILISGVVLISLWTWTILLTE